MLYLIRHGQTEGNVAKQLQGRRDVPLNDIGINQAKEAGRRLKEAGISFSRVYTSPLGRAAHTGRLVAEGVDQIIDERLIEMEYGPYEGMSLTNPAPEVLEFFKDFTHNPAPEGMEPLADIIARMASFIDDMHDVAVNEDVLVCTHAIALKGALEYLTPESRGSYWSKFIGNCAVYVTGIDENGSWIVPYSVFDHCCPL